MYAEIKVKGINKKINKWSCGEGKKEFTWIFSKEMPIQECKISSREFSSIFESQLKTMEKLVAMFMFERRFANTTACLYTNIKAAEKLGITRKTMGKALNKLVGVGVLGRVKKRHGDFVGYQYYIKEKELWKLPLEKEEEVLEEIW